jgi:SIR2-like domain
LMAQLLPDALQVLERPRYSGGSWGERVASVKQFIDDFYHLHPGTLPNLEDILTQLDDAIGEGRPLSREYNVPFLRTLREDLVFAICEVLRIKLGFGEKRGRQLMQRFMQRLGPSDSILSLNYDIIVDNALSMRSGPALLVDYGLSARYALDNSHWRRAYHLAEGIQQNQTPPLYKLHGSLNWLYCPSCQQLDVTIGQKGVHYIYEEGSDVACPDCQSRYDPLIITPTLLKTYDNILLREVWRQAEDKVSKADEVVFIGYSLPDADVLLRCMLKRALFRNRNRWHDVQGEASACKIRVVGNSPTNSETHKRYIKQFGDVEYHADGFQSYIEQLHQ